MKSGDDEQRSEPGAEELPGRVAELAGEISEAQTPSLRRRLAARLPVLARHPAAGWQRRLQHGRTGAIRRIYVSGQASWRTARTSAQWLATQALEMAPKVPMRSIATLCAQFPGRDREELAELLIDGSARAAAGVGAAVGAAVAVPVIPTFPVELGVETLALVAIEVKLIAELHEVYGMRAPGSTAERMAAYVGAWAHRRGVLMSSGGLVLAVGSPLRRQLERRIAAKAGQSVFSLGPLLTGAAAGAAINHRETRRLGKQVRDDLRRRAPSLAGTERIAPPPGHARQPC